MTTLAAYCGALILGSLAVVGIMYGIMRWLEDK